MMQTNSHNGNHPSDPSDQLPYQLMNFSEPDIGVRVSHIEWLCDGMNAVFFSARQSYQY